MNIGAMGTRTTRMGRVFTDFMRILRQALTVGCRSFIMAAMTTDVNSPDFWDESYQNGRFPWDLGRPAPVFARLAREQRFDPGKMLVAGAGLGHDAHLFARHGFEVTAVDFAHKAIAQIKALASPDAPINAVQADFFWLPPAFNAQFDYVLEYVFFCAIDPARRPDYADTVARLLAPGGAFICLAFPIGRRSGGPPFVVQPDAIIALFEQRGLVLQHREMPPDSAPKRQGIEELLIFEKAA